MLALEMDLLTGVYRAALPDGSAAEWPPHPERVFSALAQAWGDGGCDPEERAALEWLESLEPPWIEADDAEERSAPIVFVPPNDARGSEIAVLPDRRPRQARRFRVAVPVTTTVKMIWPTASPDARRKALLDALVKRVASVGHSASLVRLALASDAAADETRLWRPAADGIPLRVPHRGRLRRLEEWLAEGERPLSGATAHYRRPVPAAEDPPPKTVFGGVDDWFVFEEVGGFCPDILAFAYVAKAIRASLMALGPQPVPEILSGHIGNGDVTTNPHIAVVPLVNVGWAQSTGDLLGFAVILPRETAPADRQAALEALARFARLGEGEGATAEARLARDRIWQVERTAAPSRASLRSGRWCGSAETWASATPVLLDRFPDYGDVLEEARLIAAACRNIGLPDPAAIEIHKHSAIVAAPSAYPARGDKRRPDWTFPAGARFAQRPRRHVVLRFDRKVEGPIIFGAGRFQGFGLCLPVGAEERS
jgi:CRISPR-associated protein Csb2